jgi:hypothetical protein
MLIMIGREKPRDWQWKSEVDVRQDRKEMAMTYLLLPGRHHVLTVFQLQYLTKVTGGDMATLPDVNGKPLKLHSPIDTIVWAITSANHSNTRRNPLPANRREVAIEDFASQLDVVSYVHLIDDVGASERFAEYVLKKIEVDSQGRFRLTPENTVVGCSTPEVIALYERLGFRILPMELRDRESLSFAAETPWHLVQSIFAGEQPGGAWRTNEDFLTKVARSTRRLYLKYNYGDLITDLFRHPFLSEDGDLTETRDYNTYVRSFDEGAERKYALIKDFVVPGRIVDIGCCTGSLIQQLTRDDRLRESDFFGVEVARRLYQECLHRKQQGVFANDNVFFYQRNAAECPVFAPNSIRTFTTFALTHELESYQGRATLDRFISLLHGQLAMGGRWINVDVVGPENKDEIVSMWLDRSDGRNDDFASDFGKHDRDQCRAYLQGLSTFGRFLRFQRDFRHEEGYRMECELETVDGEPYVRLRLQDACEFMSKKDYVDNWQSEMHETFCFWSFLQWRSAVENAGFSVHPSSHAYTNPWIVENRLRGRVALFRKSGSILEPLAYPVTNMLLIAEKR